MDVSLSIVCVLESSNQICKVEGDAGNGTNRGSCEEGMLCFFDGSCRAPGNYQSSLGGRHYYEYC